MHKQTGNEWSYDSCTKTMPTDAYGKLTFPGSHSKTANVWFFIKNFEF
jgi:hypothetical protein